MCCKGINYLHFHPTAVWLQGVLRNNWSHVESIFIFEWLSTIWMPTPTNEVTIYIHFYSDAFDICNICNVTSVTWLCSLSHKSTKSSLCKHSHLSCLRSEILSSHSHCKADFDWLFASSTVLQNSLPVYNSLPFHHLIVCTSALIKPGEAAFLMSIHSSFSITIKMQIAQTKVLECHPWFALTGSVTKVFCDTMALKLTCAHAASSFPESSCVLIPRMTWFWKCKN